MLTNQVRPYSLPFVPFKTILTANDGLVLWNIMQHWSESHPKFDAQFGACSVRCMLSWVHAQLGACSVWCMLSSVHAQFGACSVRCMLSSVHAQFGACSVRCMLSSVHANNNR